VEASQQTHTRTHIRTEAGRDGIIQEQCL